MEKCIALLFVYLLYAGIVFFILFIGPRLKKKKITKFPVKSTDDWRGVEYCRENNINNLRLFMVMPMLEIGWFGKMMGGLLVVLFILKKLKEKQEAYQRAKKVPTDLSGQNNLGT